MLPNEVAIRFTGKRSESFAAFITTARQEYRISLDPRETRPWKCWECGRQPKPGCLHTAIVQAANVLRQNH